MIILIISIIAIGIGIGILVCIDDCNVWGLLLTVAGAVVALIVGALLITHPLVVRSGIQEYRAMKATIENARQIETIENTALQIKIIEMNQWVARTQYWEERLPSFYPDEVRELEPLK